MQKLSVILLKIGGEMSYTKTRLSMEKRERMKDRKKEEIKKERKKERGH
jgi:hypothetical protein